MELYLIFFSLFSSFQFVNGNGKQYRHCHLIIMQSESFEVFEKWCRSRGQSAILLCTSYIRSMNLSAKLVQIMPTIERTNERDKSSWWEKRWSVFRYVTVKIKSFYNEKYHHYYDLIRGMAIPWNIYFYFVFWHSVKYGENDKFPTSIMFTFDDLMYNFAIKWKSIFAIDRCLGVLHGFILETCNLNKSKM